jgi:hypothetical protein
MCRKQALLEVAAENNLKLAENFTGKDNLITEAITKASGKITKKKHGAKSRRDAIHTEASAY